MNTTRRTFLRTTAAATLGFPAILRAARPNGKVQIAAIGASGKGLSDITEIGSHKAVEYVGFADVDSSKFQAAARKYPVVPQFADFREMLAKLGDTCDAVIVSTPDHLHAAAGLLAMNRGKHLYCQKPLTHTVWEARQMRLAAEKSRVITQMGNQIHSHEHYRTAVKFLREGGLGKISAVHSWQNKVGNHYTHLTGTIPEPGPVPETLNWDLWIGPAPMRDYAPNAYHPEKWRDWQDFGGGVMGDFGCHILDPVFTALGLGAPQRLVAENSGLNPQTWPVSEKVRYTFPELTLTWYDGGTALPDELKAQLPADFKLPAAGSIFVGEGGLLLLPHVNAPQLFENGQASTREIEKVAGANHYHAWVDSILSGEQTSDNFAYAAPLTEAVLLGTIATRFPGQELHWDATAMRFPNFSDADRLLTKTYREGWQIRAVS